MIRDDSFTDVIGDKYPHSSAAESAQRLVTASCDFNFIKSLSASMILSQAKESSLHLPKGMIKLFDIDFYFLITFRYKPMK